MKGNPGRFLSRLFGILSGARWVLSRCSRWGCLLPVGEGSEFGRGPVCMVCRYGLRTSAVPPREGITLWQSDC